jgi:CMP-2-keto-3-deoxyoctulosonic acid synthetase
MADFDVSDAIICEHCGYPIHPAAIGLARVIAQVHTDDPTVPAEDLAQCYRCAYQHEAQRAAVLADLLRRRHSLDPTEVIAVLGDS